MSSRFSFKKNVKFDIALLTEVESLNPFSHKNPKLVWEEIAVKLQQCDLKMKVTDRSCRERVEILIKEFSKSETISSKLSGVEESEMNEIQYFMTSVAKLYADKSIKASQYSKSQRIEAEKIRESALEEIKFEVEDCDLEDECDMQVNNVTEVPKAEEKVLPEIPKKRMRKADVIGFFQDKNDSEMSFKNEELKLRFLEAENKKFELTLARERMQMEKETKDRELEIQSRKQEAESEERKLISSTLVSIVSGLATGAFKKD